MKPTIFDQVGQAIKRMDNNANCFKQLTDDDKAFLNSLQRKIANACVASDCEKLFKKITFDEVVNYGAKHGTAAKERIVLALAAQNKKEQIASILNIFKDPKIAPAFKKFGEAIVRYEESLKRVTYQDIRFDRLSKLPTLQKALVVPVRYVNMAVDLAANSGVNLVRTTWDDATDWLKQKGINLGNSKNAKLNRPIYKNPEDRVVENDRAAQQLLFSGIELNAKIKELKIPKDAEDELLRQVAFINSWIKDNYEGLQNKYRSEGSLVLVGTGAFAYSALVVASAGTLAPTFLAALEGASITVPFSGGLIAGGFGGAGITGVTHISDMTLRAQAAANDKASSFICELSARVDIDGEKAFMDTLNSMVNGALLGSGIGGTIGVVAIKAPKIAGALGIIAALGGAAPAVISTIDSSKQIALANQKVQKIKDSKATHGELKDAEADANQEKANAWANITGNAAMVGTLGAGVLPGARKAFQKNQESKSADNKSSDLNIQDTSLSVAPLSNTTTKVMLPATAMASGTLAPVTPPTLPPVTIIASPVQLTSTSSSPSKVGSAKYLRELNEAKLELVTTEAEKLQQIISKANLKHNVAPKDTEKLLALKQEADLLRNQIPLLRHQEYTEALIASAKKFEQDSKGQSIKNYTKINKFSEVEYKAHEGIGRSNVGKEVVISFKPIGNEKPMMFKGIVEEVVNGESEFYVRDDQGVFHDIKLFANQVDKVYFKRTPPPANMTDSERLLLASKVLGHDLTKLQKKEVIRAHEVGKGEIGEDGINPAGLDNYTPLQLRQKAKILRKAGFGPEETRKLVVGGVVGLDLRDVARIGAFALGWKAMDDLTRPTPPDYSETTPGRYHSQGIPSYEYEPRISPSTGNKSESLPKKSNLTPESIKSLLTKFANTPPTSLSSEHRLPKTGDQMSKRNFYENYSFKASPKNSIQDIAITNPEDPRLYLIKDKNNQNADQGKVILGTHKLVLDKNQNLIAVDIIYGLGEKSTERVPIEKILDYSDSLRGTKQFFEKEFAAYYPLTISDNYGTLEGATRAFLIGLESGSNILVFGKIKIDGWRPFKPRSGEIETLDGKIIKLNDVTKEIVSYTADPVEVSSKDIKP